jgi:hypothetical protein
MADQTSPKVRHGMPIDSQAFEFRRPEWQQHALCRGRTDEFFAQRMPRAKKQELVAICQKCPVCTPCLELALTFEIDDDGIFGGLDPVERKKLRNERIINASGEIA